MKIHRNVIAKLVSGTSLVLGFVLVAGAGAATTAHAASPLYYEGDAQVTNLQTGAVTTQAMAVVKTLDPASDQFTEVACTKDTGAAAHSFPTYVRVAGNSVVAMSESPTYQGVMSGTGELTGEPWNWTTLHFSIQWHEANGSVIDIDDWNWIVDDHLVARKRISSAGVAVQLWEVDARPIDASAYHARLAALGCPD